MTGVGKASAFADSDATLFAGAAVSAVVLVTPDPLSSVETEQALLGAVLMHPEAMSSIESIVVANDFWEPLHRDLFAKFLETRDEGYSVTPRIVTATLGFLGVQTVCNIPVKNYVARLAAAAAHPGEAPELARAIRDLAQRRALLSVGEHLKGMIENDASVFHTAGAAIEALDEIIASRSAAHTKSVWIDEAAIGSIDRMVEAIQNPGKLPGITTGFRDLDERTGGFQRGEFVVLAGRPGMGKSALAITMARLMARAGHNVLLNSLEMDSYSVADRVMADIAWQPNDPIQYSRLRTGTVTIEQQQRLTDAARAFNNLPIRVDPQSGLTLSQIAARARKHKQSLERQGKTLDALIVDHMHIVAASNRYAGQPVREVTEISGALKALAKELNLPVIALAQLNRSVEGRDNKRPTLSDLRESGAIEQDADLIAFVFREAYPRKKQPSEAFRAYRKVIDEGKTTHSELLARTREFSAESSQRAPEDRRFIPYPASRLNAGGYLDEPDAAIEQTSAISAPSKSPSDFNEADWRKRLEYSAKVGKWPESEWGPALGKPGCLVPAALLPKGAAHPGTREAAS